jgi:hypothetical protein
MIKWLKILFSRKKIHVVVLPEASKKDAKYAEEMYRLMDEEDERDLIDFGEAYNFHMDCGDR